MSGLEDRIAALKKVSLLEGLSQSQLEAVASCCRFQRVSKGTTILQQGTPGLTMYVVLSGRFRIVQSKEKGEPVVVAERTTGDVLGEMSLLEEAPRSASVVATELSRVLALDRAVFEQHVLKHPDTCLALLRTLSARIREASSDLVSMRSEPLPSRLVRYFQLQTEKDSGLVFQINQTEWASELGCSREALNRNLKKMVEAGSVEYLGRGSYKWLGSSRSA